MLPRTGFTPSLFSGLQVWLDAADSATLFDATTGGSLPANNAAVARWMDKGPSAFDFTQGTANNRPIRKVQQRNGLDGVYFDGSNDCLYKSANVFDTTVTLLAVADFDDNTSRRVIVDLGSVADNLNKNLAIEQNTFQTVGNRYSLYATGNTYDSDLATSSGAKVFCVTADATLNNNVIDNTTYRVNGATRTLTGRSLATAAYRDSTTGDAKGVMVGAFNNNGANLAASLGMKGHVYEIIAYNVRLTSDQIGFIERYLANKWGVSL